MNGSHLATARRVTLGLALGGAAALGTSGCGGAGGASTGDTLVGLVLVNFVQSGEDNLPLNRVLEFDFSSPIDPDTVDFSSIQLRQGPAFGLSVPGKYIVQGSRVLFQPRLPGLCNLTDGGLQPNIDYRVTILGAPEEFAIRNLAGAPLQTTISASFHTRLDTDPELFEDALPGTGPSVVQTSPVDGAYPDGPPVVFPAVANPAASNYPEVYIGSGNQVVIDFSENLHPCSVTENTVRFYQYAVGDQPTMPDGFLPGPDVTPGDPFTWGSGTATSPARRVRANYALSQGFLSTRLVITPLFTDAFGNPEFPDNALLVVEVTNGVKDFGGTALLPTSFAFVTQNRPPVDSQRVIEFLGETPIDANLTTADVNTSRSVGKAQGFVLFAGDGDNGLVLTRASGPDNTSGPPACTTPAGIPQANDGLLDDFDPLGDAALDTGSTVNKCKNTADGSTAVVFEFRSFHIRNNVTVRIIGANPAILLIQGDVLIDNGGRLLVKGDGNGGSPQANGVAGAKLSTNSSPGGTGVAGGGKGGMSPAPTATGLAESGTTGYYNSPPGTPALDVGTVGGAGAGHGNISAYWSTQFNANNRNSPGGGGGGHAAAGVTGANTGAGTTPTVLDGAADGQGGSTYGDVTSKMSTPEAGSGGGGAGTLRTIYGGTTGTGPGGGGGAGGGFVDLTAKGSIFVFGFIDASGGRGGAGGTATTYSWEPGTGGGGGGSGGGIRLLTPKSINFGANSLVTAAGGTGGIGGVAQASPAATPNDGGAGGAGRIVLEDSDSVITGYVAGSTNPADGAQGFYRGLFDATRFQGGGLTPQVVSGLIDIGPTQPSYYAPIQNYGVQEDFIANVPLISTRGFNAPSMFFEVQGFPANPDGTANLVGGTGWKSVGYFKDSSAAAFPTWVPGTPTVGNTPTALPDGQIPSLPQGNTGGSIASINLMEFIKFRVTFYLKAGTGAFDEGPSVDRWTINFFYNQ